MGERERERERDAITMICAMVFYSFSSHLSCAEACCRRGDKATACSPSSTFSMPPSKLNRSCAWAVLCTRMDSRPTRGKHMEVAGSRVVVVWIS